MPDTARRPAAVAEPPTIAHAVLSHVVGAHLFGHHGYHAVNEASDADDGDQNGDQAKLVDIPEDAYGAAILAFVRDVPRLFHTADSDEWETALWNCTFSLLLLFVNLVLQGSILLYVYHYVVALDIAHVQSRYRHFKFSVFSSEGEFLDDKWEVYQARSDLCEIAMWNRPFFYAVLLCWALVMMIEIKKSEELAVHIWRLVPSCRRPEEMTVSKGGEHIYVVAFTPMTRLALLLSVALPKIGISVVLLWLGCEWLSATIKFESLVMNTVAMAFIVNIDEILFEAVLPPAHREDVSNIDFLIARESLTEKQLFLKRRQAFRKSLLYLFSLIAFVIFYAEYMQDVLPPDIRLVRVKCKRLIFDEQQPFCNGWTWYFRGNPAVHDCFPFPDPPPAVQMALNQPVPMRDVAR